MYLRFLYSQGNGNSCGKLEKIKAKAKDEDGTRLALCSISLFMHNIPMCFIFTHLSCFYWLSNLFMNTLSTFQMNKAAFPKIDENKDNKTDNKTASTEKGRAAIVFSLKNEVGGLVKALKLFQVWLTDCCCRPSLAH